MRHLILALALVIGTLFTSACGQPQQTATAFSIPGLPTTDHQWQTADYRAAADALSALPPSQLPRSDGPASEALFQRLSDASILARYADQNIPLADRMQDALSLLEASGQIFRAYVVAQQTDISYSDDALRLMGFMLRMAGAMSELVDEFLPTLDTTDPSYSTRLLGFEQMRFGFVQIVQGCLTSLTTDRRVYSDEAATELAATLAEIYPVLSRNFPDDTKSRFTSTIAEIARTDHSPAVRATLFGVQ